jgi:hypothetical protein
MTTSQQDESRLGLVGHIIGLWTEPGATFPSILRRPRVLAPLLVLVALQIGFTGYWLQKVDAKEFLKAQMEESGQWEKIPAESRPQVLESQSRMIPVFAWTGAVLGAPILALVIGSVYLFIFRFFYASTIGFKPALSLVAHTLLAVSLVTTPLILLVMTLRDDWTVNPQNAIQANLSLVLGDREDVPKFLWSLCESLDLFSFWVLFLLAVGFGAATGRRWTAVLAGVLTPWAIYVLGKSTLAAIF